MLSERRQQLIVTAGCLACVAVIVTAIAIATDYWCEARVIPYANTDIEGSMNFGLFRTSVDYNFGLGIRDVEKSVYSELEGAFNLNWLIVIIVVSLLSVLSGLTAITLSFANAWTIRANPFISPRAVIIWNGLAVICNAVAVVIFVILHYTQLQYNVIGEQWRNDVSSDDAYFGYSFWVMCAPGWVYLIDILLLVLSQWIATWDNDESHETKNDVAMKDDISAVLF